MRYIRTEDSVFDLEDEKYSYKVENNILFECLRDNHNVEWRDCGEILNQSDHLEKLMDVFVTESKELDLKYRYNTYKSLKGAMDCANANGREIKVYGSLWNKNATLTPVSKVDAEGNLHLLPR